MAASFDPAGKRWFIAAADAGATVIDTNDLRVSGIRWVVAAGGAAGNTAVVTEPDGTTVLWKAVNQSGAQYDEIDNMKRRWPKGFAVPTLSAGELFIYLE